MPNFQFVAATLVRYMAYGPCRVRKIFGMNNQGSTVYIQLHATPPLVNGTLTAGTVPVIKSLQCLANLPFAFTLPTIEMPECLIALSTTELNYTAVGAGGGLDMTVELESNYLATDFRLNSGLAVSIIGDLTTTVNFLQCWTQASGLNPVGNNIGRLLRVDVTEQLGVARFISVLPFDSINTFQAMAPNLGQLATPAACIPLPASGTVNMFFGRKGITPYIKDAAGNEYKGCSIWVVDSPVNPSGARTANSAVIRAITSPLIIT